MLRSSGIKWLIEKPAQQLQIQKGEQSSACSSPASWAALENAETVFSWPTAVSAQGITLNARIIRAIMKAKIFTVAKIWVIECVTNQKI